MIFWSQFPFVRILLFYLLGIFTSEFLDIKIPKQFFVYTLIFLITILIISRIKLRSYRFRFIPGYCIGALLILLGFTISNQNHSTEQPLGSNPMQDYLFLITEQPIEKSKSIKVLGKIYADLPENTELGKSIFYFAKDSLALSLKYGDLLKINIRLNQIEPPQNPHEFDYKKYLKNRKIYYQSYIPSDSWKFLDRKQANQIKQLALDARQYSMTVLLNSNLSKSEYAVSIAILLGQDEILDDETRQDYAGAGAMHVLCVSGLHVGVIYLVFNFLLSFLKTRRFQQLLSNIFLFLLIWAYALITGFSPSVLRATVMLSFIILGGTLNKKGNIYNSVAASAFLLLLINPLMIKEVGFQLSYAAVIGIISIYPLLKKHLSHSNQIIDKTLSILIVSFAAQIGTFPLAIFYFHQFPVYFLLTNLVVILLATLIINLGFLFLLLSSVPIISSGFQYVLKSLIYSMNTSVAFVESLPGSTFKSMVLHPAEVIVFYLVIIGITQSLLRKSKSWFVLSFTSILLLGFGFTFRNFSQLNQKKVIIYNIKGHTIFEFQKGRNASVFMDSILMGDQQKINYHLSPNWINSGVRRPQWISIHEKHYQRNEIELIKKSGIYLFENKIFLRIDRENYNRIKNYQTALDYLIISENVKISLKDIFNHFKPKLIILDSSNSFYYEKDIIMEAIKNEIPIYAVNNKGACIIKL